jgi:hypothetical protein
VIVGVDSDPANCGKITDWAKSYYDALHPFGAGGAYVNFMMEEGEDRIRATYRGNYDRLEAIEAKWHPEYPWERSICKLQRALGPEASESPPLRHIAPPVRCSSHTPQR